MTLLSTSEKSRDWPHSPQSDQTAPRPAGHLKTEAARNKQNQNQHTLVPSASYILLHPLQQWPSHLLDMISRSWSFGTTPAMWGIPAPGWMELGNPQTEGMQKWWEQSPNEKWRFVAGKIMKLNGGFSGKPWLTRREKTPFELPRSIMSFIKNHGFCI